MRPKINVSLTMIVKNEETHIERCLLSVKDIVDEMIVVDTGSTDKTKIIAQTFGARVYDFIWTNSFADARNYALQQASGDWCLVLDADEYLAQESAHLVRRFIEQKRAIGRVNIVSKYLDNDEIRYARSPISRLFPKGVYYTGKIHEQVVSDLPHVLTDITVYHDGYYLTDKTSRNLELLELELKEDEHNPYILMQMAREYKNRQDYLQADIFFEQAYQRSTKQEGYFPVLVVDYLYNLIKIGKLDQGMTVIDSEQSRLSAYPDFHFVSGLFYMDYILSNVASHADKLYRIEECFLTCLRLGERNSYSGIVGTGSFLAAFNLGVFYEVIGELQKAVQYYQASAEKGYKKAADRLKHIQVR
jgi:glycosyltransferase involved in cell wall biosynthesis